LVGRAGRPPVKRQSAELKAHSLTPVLSGESGELTLVTSDPDGGQGGTPGFSDHGSDQPLMELPDFSRVYQRAGQQTNGFSTF